MDDGMNTPRKIDLNKESVRSNIGIHEYGLITITTKRMNELIEIEKKWNFIKDSLKGKQNDNN